MMDKLQSCLNVCLKKGNFPKAWKTANLVLIPKENPQSSVIVKARPICLLDDIGKIFERVIVERILQWIAENLNADFSNNQYGFRKQRLTVDVLRIIQDETHRVINRGSISIAVSLDIANAFYSLPWYPW